MVLSGIAKAQKKHLDHPVPDGDFLVLHCLGIRSSVSDWILSESICLNFSQYQTCDHYSACGLAMLISMYDQHVLAVKSLIVLAHDYTLMLCKSSLIFFKAASLVRGGNKMAVAKKCTSTSSEHSI